MADQEVKEIAYRLDPECWKSYSGKERAFKQRMEGRRTRSLSKAQDIFDRSSPQRETFEEEVRRRLDALEAATSPHSLAGYD